ncbi:hypothetical protein [Micromonospora globbae]|uniref:hypothetical protein n=1 Tax=Micromonospora globbae TaxID=1894969 RepID=UPI003428D43D
MTQLDRIDGGMDATRLSAAEQDRARREQRQADALAYLLARDLADVAEILGITPYTCLNCGLPMGDDAKGWFCRRKDTMCNSPRVRRQARAHAAARGAVGP